MNPFLNHFLFSSSTPVILGLLKLNWSEKVFWMSAEFNDRRIWTKVKVGWRIDKCMLGESSIQLVSLHNERLHGYEGVPLENCDQTEELMKGKLSSFSTSWL